MDGISTGNWKNLPEHWKLGRIGDYCEVRRGASPRPAGDPRYFGGEIPWFKIGDATKGKSRFLSKTAEFVTELGAKNSVKISEGTLIISNSGVSLGFAIFAGVTGCVHDGWLVLNKFNGLDPKYLYYSINYLTNFLREMADGTTQPNLNTTIARNLLIPVPPLYEQKSIAQLLWSIDDKIELNHEMNQTLERIAQATFKHWFIDFQFPGFDGELIDGLPKEWKQTPIDEIAEFLNGLAMQKFPPDNETDYLPVIKIRELRQGITDSSDKASVNIPNQYIVNNGDILFSWSGSLEVVIWYNGKGGLNQHLFKVSSKKYPKWFYYFWTK
jgi:type I restriction enzyme, S subunit